MNKKVLLIVGGIVGVLMLCACVAVAGFMAFRYYRTLGPTNVVSNQPTPEVLVVDVTEVPVVETQAAVDPEPLPEANLDVEEARGVANDFMLLLSEREYGEAVQLTDSTLRGDASGTEEQLRALVEDKALEPVIWEWTAQDGNGQNASFDGVVNLADERRGYVKLELLVEEGQWRVNFLDLKTDGVSVDPGPMSQWTDERTGEEVAFAKSAADIFLIDWQNDDYEGAFNMGAQAMTEEVGSAEKLEEILGGLGVHPDTWSWDSYELLDQGAEERPVLVLTGQVDYLENKSGPVTVQLKWEDGFWWVLFFDVKVE